MKLRAISLTNVRKFTGRRAQIRGIGDGVTVVSEANEFGKSTFFDAIHALFFEKYSSDVKAVKSLQPYAGGAVEIAAEVETPQGLFRVEKSFRARKSARILRLPDATVIAQDDEAERWIAALLGPSGEGPAGLLWVRQGLVGLEPDRAAEKSALMETRRDLLSSVGAEVDALTGGRRMDRALRQVAEDLGELTTRTGRKTGAWKALLDEIAAMEAALAVLDGQVATLDGALSDRRIAEAERARLDDPVAQSRRDAALARSRAALDAAMAHAARLQTARQQADIAKLHAANAQATLDGFLAAQSTLITARAAAAQTATDAQTATAEMANLGAQQQSAEKAQQVAATALIKAQTAVEATQRHAARQSAQADATRLRAALQDAQFQMVQLDAAQTALRAAPVPPDWLRRVERAEAEVIRHQSALQAQATTLHLTYDGPTRVLQDGSPLAEGQPIVLEDTVSLDLPGIGRMEIRSGGATSARAAAATLGQAQAALAALLKAGQVPDPDAARAAAAARAQAERASELATALLRSIAPDGTDALRGALALAEAAAAGRDEDTPPPDAEALRDKAASQHMAAEAARKAADLAHSASREAAATAREKAATAAIALTRAEAAAGPQDSRASREADLLRACAETRATFTEAGAALKTLTESAPDLATIQAEAKRCADAVASVASRRGELSDRLIGLDAEIRTLAGNGVEERRDELAGRLDAARAREALTANRAEALIRLQDALLAQRSAAHDAYFGPVRDELRPLLAILHRDADLSFDSDSLLPGSLSRGGDTETLEALSGGTREQIAILTRLAFARLFARKGRHMPIILDDALVYSDDDRIVKMFTALTRVAADQQIIVFSCRQLAFQDLGGARPRVEIG